MSITRRIWSADLTLIDEGDEGEFFEKEDILRELKSGIRINSLAVEIESVTHIEDEETPCDPTDRDE